MEPKGTLDSGAPIILGTKIIEESEEPLEV